MYSQHLDTRRSPLLSSKRPASLAIVGVPGSVRRDWGREAMTGISGGDVASTALVEPWAYGEKPPANIALRPLHYLPMSPPVVEKNLAGVPASRAVACGGRERA